MPRDTWMGAVAELAASRHGAFTRRQAADRGVDSVQLRGLIDIGVLAEPTTGVLVFVSSVDTIERRLAVATCAGGGHGVAVGVSAARLHGLDGFEAETAAYVAIPRGARLAVQGVRGSQILGHYPADHLDEVGGVPCTNLARTVIDLARFAPKRFERAADDFQRRGASLQWLSRTLDSIEPRKGDRLDVVRADLDRRLRGGRAPDSWFERLVERCLRSPILPEPVRQFEVRDERSSLVARVDLAFPHLRLAVEAHSRRFHTGPRSELADQDRDARLSGAGWLTMYVGWLAATRTPAQVCRRVEEVAVRRARDLGLPLAP